MTHLYFTACLAFFILQGFFAASEISFISSRSLRLRHRQGKGDKRAKKVYELIAKPERFLVTTLVGTNISMVLSSSLLTFWLMRLGINSSNLWITIVYTPLVVIFAELVPKNIGRFFREDFSCRVVGMIYFFEKLFMPVVKIIEILSRLWVKVFIKKAKYRLPFVTKEEIKFLVSEIEQQGGIDRGEKKAIEEVFEFRSDKIKDVCVEIKKVKALDYADSREGVFETIKANKFTRYPVFKNRQVAGYLNIYDLFYCEKENWQKLIRPITKVGVNQDLQEVFTRLKAKKENMALVIKGKKAYGIVTIHDLVKEIMTSIVR
ncbi:MAG: CNNM domain-containing protein [Candidatus Omnitrophota bacterium]|jgi:putative hemolysin